MAPIRFMAARLWTTLATVAVLCDRGDPRGGSDLRADRGGGIALYFVVWWIRSSRCCRSACGPQIEHEAVGAGTDPGAPATPALREKAIWTTLVAAFVLLIAAAAMPLAGL